jgi:putative membrane protein
MNRIVALAAVLAFAAACGDSDADTQAAADSTTTTTAAPATDAATPAPAAAAPASTVTDPQIAAIVVAANDVDIAAGNLARERASDQRVKDFAQRMITDHTGVNKAATDLVTRLGVTPEPNATSQKLTSDGEASRTTLQGQSGAAFDKAYVDQEVAYHQAVLDAIDQTLIPSAQNAELKALLEQTRPAVAAHLDHARQLKTQLGGA